LTALLIIIIILNAIAIIGIALAAASKSLLGLDITLPAWSIATNIIFAVLAIFFAVGLFMWKKWGFWGLVVVEAVIVAINISGGNYLSIISAIVSIGLLYGVLQIGGANKGWTQLE